MCLVRFHTTLVYGVARTHIESEVSDFADQFKRREMGKADQKRRTDIRRYYDHLRSTKAFPIIPSLAEFRKLTVIKMFQDTHVPLNDVKDELKNSPTIGDFLRDSIEQWTEAARRDLAVVLGYAAWRNPSAKILHPVDRVTGRFLCQRCKRTGKNAIVGSLDFAGACTHECNDLTAKERARKPWYPEQFVPDQKVRVC